MTIDDVVYVIDCGKVKEKSFDAFANVSVFKPNWISQASAIQRAGRLVHAHLFINDEQLVASSHGVTLVYLYNSNGFNPPLRYITVSWSIPLIVSGLVGVSLVRHTTCLVLSDIETWHHIRWLKSFVHHCRYLLG